ncbi:MAG: bifunctional diaminohydroxyphosphoribosylaminopyrimidine deaminase/5-amino-6-(5-phosphoribosylamino)uracil reductase RibD [Candidatus Nanopelagicales bacterium]|nr:bifunctional diaminohydroxyphosphoribosylaminopyrimidine deaminase/5-amino-6-(5-phosphoribosylamino)uracil reductase RibD [Candidatus Nanopelagicales bacterium]MDZ4249682.1 bifunctional diaminohydroxyphosphoribosylaminopyrimidine deaminase/5-amino-6-(5-phosphoribosylamino)uracil reductase RibD [Candidatus Nanopelagicales bacterium]
MDEKAALRRAIELAANSPDTRPNPRVGCVILDGDGCVVSEGWHEGAGGPHAEVVALRAAGQRSRGATAVVSLEPCDHHGRTGPCSAALIEADVSRVVFAQADPNPAASGGADRLRDAGVAVEGGLMAEESAAVNPHWTFAMSSGRPFVTWKTAATLDGRVAARDGSSRWISGPESREEVHQLRAEADAVLIGTGTLLADDPRLSARPRGGSAKRQPLRAVMGQRSVPAAARIRETEGFLRLRTREPAEALSELYALDVHHLLLEGGPTLATAFLRAGVVDRVVWYAAPALLGSGPGAIADLGIGSVDGARRFELSAVARVGDDVRLDLLPLSPGARI